VQDCFLRAWRNAHAFDPGRGSAMAWLARIVRNRCIDVVRQRGRETPLDNAAIEDWEDSASSPADLTALSRDAGRLQDCLDELEEGPRKILKLVYYEGMTYREAAAHVGVPLGTAKTWVRQSLVRLKGCMER
jgi:RNA polymerase sigma-70 factor, ECF subfamily